MSVRDVLRSISMLAPGKRVSVRDHGIIYALPAEPPPEPVIPPNPVEVAAKQLLESDAQTRELIQSFGPKVEESLVRVEQAVEMVAAGQFEVVQTVKENTRTLHLPVKPKYNKAGKLIAAQRDE